MLVIGGLHADIQLEPKDYFFVTVEGVTLKVILTNGQRRPLNIRGVSRRQAYSLISQLQRAMMLQDQVRLEELVEETVDTDTAEQGGAEHEEHLAGQEKE
jgi:hypothetical protein